MSKLAIIDSGGANITSLLCAFERLGVDATLSHDAAFIQAADRVVLPGVGAARDAMDRLLAANLTDVIRDLRQPVLGVCLGMQLLCDGSEEDDAACLGIIPGMAHRLPAADGYPVPNMGWCETSLSDAHPVCRGLESGDYFYYVHSYAVPVAEHTLATAKHTHGFSAMLGRDNFVAAQFHPERSSAAGARLLQNFLEWTL